MRTSWRHLRCGLLLATVLLSGCRAVPTTDYSQLDLVEIDGCVRLDGIVLKGARVEFESPDGSCSTGVTDARGRYRLMYTSEQPGCLPGEKIVRIRMDTTADEVEDPDAPNSSPVYLPPRYNIESGLTARVTPGERTFDFELTTAEVELTASDH